MNRKLIAVFLCLGAIVIGMSGCYSTGTVATPTPTLTATYRVTALPSIGALESVNPMVSETLTPIMTPTKTPVATTVSSTRASIVTLAKAVTNISKIKSAVVVRNDDKVIVGVMFDRDKYNGDLTEALTQQIIDVLESKDSYITTISITDNITDYYKIEDLAKQTNLTSEQLQAKMDAIIK